VSALNIEHSSPDAEATALGIIFGRFMLPDMTEHACQVTDVTLEGATFMSVMVPPQGQALVAYLEEVGRVEAISAGAVQGGFKINYTLQGARLERLQQRIQWLRNKDENAPDGRRHARYEPTEKVSQIVLPDGRVYNCEVLDISVSGAAIKTEVMPSVGTFLMLGKMRGRVVRYLEMGVAIEFVKQLAPTQLPPVAGPSLL
jgi:PilZ domain